MDVSPIIIFLSGGWSQGVAEAPCPPQTRLQGRGHGGSPPVPGGGGSGTAGGCLLPMPAVEMPRRCCHSTGHLLQGAGGLGAFPPGARRNSPPNPVPSSPRRYQSAGLQNRGDFGRNEERAGCQVVITQRFVFQISGTQTPPLPSPTLEAPKGTPFHSRDTLLFLLSGSSLAPLPWQAFFSFLL